MSKNAWIAVIAVVVVGCLIAGFFVLNGQRQGEEAVTVRIGYLNIVASLPLFIAEEKGFLKDEGVQFATTPVATSNQLVDATISGNLDCYIESSAVPVLAADLRAPGRLKIFAVSEITAKTPFDSLLVKKDSQIKALSDLSGKKIGVFPGSTAASLLKKYLSDKGIDVSKTMFVPMPPENLLPALLKGAVDAIHAYEPTTAIALSKGDVRKLFGSVYAEMLSPNPQGVAALNVKFMQAHPEAAAKVVRALERAMVYMKEHDAESREVLVKRLKLPKDAADRCVFLYMIPHKDIDKGILQKYADMLTGIGELDGKLSTGSLIYSK